MPHASICISKSELKVPYEVMTYMCYFLPEFVHISNGDYFYHTPTLTTPQIKQKRCHTYFSTRITNPRFGVGVQAEAQHAAPTAVFVAGHVLAKVAVNSCWMQVNRFTTRLGTGNLLPTPQRRHTCLEEMGLAQPQ